MAYAEKSLSTVDVMTKNFSSLADEIKGLEKAKAPDKAKIKTLKADLEKKGKAIGAKYDELISLTQKDFLAHGALVDSKLTEATAALRSAKKTAETFDPKSPDPKLLMALTKPSLVEKVKAVGEAAQADSDAFGKSWFKLRGCNPLSATDALAPYVKAFFEKRSELMGEAKGVLTKIHKIDDYADQIGVLTNDLRAGFTKTGGAAPADAEASVDALGDEFLTWVKFAKGGELTVLALKRLKSVASGMAAYAKPGEKEVKQFQGTIREGIEAAKTCNSRLDTFTQKTAQAKKMFGGSSRKVDVTIGQIEAGIKAQRDLNKSLNDAVAAAGPALNKLQARVKANA